VVGGNNVVMNTGCPLADGQLEDLGFNLYEAPLDECLKAGGSAKCLTLIMG
jgi:N-dimethylarginine dimethylaminohydrolase